MNDTKRATVRGTVEDVIYRNKENDYTVIDVATEENELITAVGIMPFIGEGEYVTLVGEWVSHSGYGQQLSVHSFEKRLPEDLSSILRYLTSRQIKGIGTATAVKIVNKYGKDTFDVIENHPEWLASINGITMKRAAEISKSFSDMSEMRELTMLVGDGVGTQTLNKIYKKFGSGAVGIIRDNPYRLCSEMSGVSFAKADAIAKSLGIESDAPMRIENGVRHALTSAMNVNGHTCLPIKDLISETSRLISVPADKIAPIITDMLSSGALVGKMRNGVDLIYLPEAHRAERYIAKKLLDIDRATDAFSRADIEIMTSRIESEWRIEYASMQRRAIFEALGGGVLIITGGPGTGKTTVVRALIKICRSVGLKTALAAPTGRAAKRLSEATSEEAKTVHRMLEMERTDTDIPRYNRNERNPLDENVVILDEASMLDLYLTSALLRAMKNGSRLILIGDCDQLPSVGAGNVLSDLIASKRFNTVELDKVFRQSDNSLIIDNAHKINRAQMPVLDSKNADFFFLPREEEKIADTVISLIGSRLPKTYGEGIRADIQIITPSKKGTAGTDELNIRLQETLNPKSSGKSELRIGIKTFREGDRIMQTRNNYDAEWEHDFGEGSGIFNGDIGTIEEIDTQRERVRLRFDDRITVYDYQKMEDIDLAYAITVHKSQGSEYPIVIIPLYAAPSILLTRNMIYTALTRARKMVILVGRRDILSRMVQNGQRAVRYTGLIDELSQALE